MPGPSDQGAVMQAAIKKRAENEAEAPPEPRQTKPAPPQKVRQRKRAREDVVAGAISGAVARFIIGPLDVLKIRFQVQVEPISTVRQSASKYTSIPQAFRLILKEEGIQAGSRLFPLPSLQMHYIC